MELAITIVEISLYLSIFVFPVTLLILIKTVKQQNLDLVKSAITNPFFPNIDLRFFENLRQEYYRISGNRLLAKINKTSQYIMIAGFFLLFALVIVNEAIRYY
jgi:hypothetical protein